MLKEKNNSGVDGVSSPVYAKVDKGRVLPDKANVAEVSATHSGRGQADNEPEGDIYTAVNKKVSPGGAGAARYDTEQIAGNHSGRGQADNEPEGDIYTVVNKKVSPDGAGAARYDTEQIADNQIYSLAGSTEDDREIYDVDTTVPNRIRHDAVTRDDEGIGASAKGANKYDDADLYEKIEIGAQVTNRTSGAKIISGISSHIGHGAARHDASRYIDSTYAEIGDYNAREEVSAPNAPGAKVDPYKYNDTGLYSDINFGDDIDTVEMDTNKVAKKGWREKFSEFGDKASAFFSGLRKTSTSPTPDEYNKLPGGAFKMKDGQRIGAQKNGSKSSSSALATPKVAGGTPNIPPLVRDRSRLPLPTTNAAAGNVQVSEESQVASKRPLTPPINTQATSDALPRMDSAIEELSKKFATSRAEGNAATKDNASKSPPTVASKPPTPVKPKPQQEAEGKTDRAMPVSSTSQQTAAGSATSVRALVKQLEGATNCTNGTKSPLPVTAKPTNHAININRGGGMVR